MPGKSDLGPPRLNTGCCSGNDGACRGRRPTRAPGAFHAGTSIMNSMTAEDRVAGRLRETSMITPSPRH